MSEDLKGNSGHTQAPAGGGDLSQNDRLGSKPAKKSAYIKKADRPVMGQTARSVSPPPLPPREDVDMVAKRKDFETLLVQLLVATTDDLADARYKLLLAQVPNDLARELADKAKLTENEKKVFGGLVVRLWEKYTGGLGYTDEMMAAAMVMAYHLRNKEPLRLIAEVTGKVAPPPPKKETAHVNGTDATQRSIIPGAPNPNPGSERNWQDDAGLPTH
jgi:hypothetical protein